MRHYCSAERWKTSQTLSGARARHVIGVKSMRVELPLLSLSAKPVGRVRALRMTYHGIPGSRARSTLPNVQGEHEKTKRARLILIDTPRYVQTHVVDVELKNRRGVTI